MRRTLCWLAFIAICVTRAVGAPELRLPEYSVGTNTYSNVVITATSGDRVLVEYSLGTSTSMAAFKIQDLEYSKQEELLHAGLISGAYAKKLERAIAKRDAAKRREEKKAARGPVDQPELSLEKAKEESLAKILAAQMEYQVEANDVEMELQPWLDRYGERIIYGIMSVSGFLVFLRLCLYYKICKKATGEGSFLVFLPIIRWFVLVGASGMSRHWLLVPAFAVAASFLPPVTVNQYPWAPLAYLIFLGVLWLATGILYIVWCVRLCRAVDCSGGLALLMLIPVLEFIALFTLASSNGGAQTYPGGHRMKKPALAV